MVFDRHCFFISIDFLMPKVVVSVLKIEIL